MISLNLNGIKDEDVRQNFQDIQNILNAQVFDLERFQAIEIYVTANVTGLKISHRLGGIPLDVIPSRLIAPSAARLTPKFSEFTKNEVVFDVSGLSAGETLSARLLIGIFIDVVTVGEVARGDNETQQLRSKF